MANVHDLANAARRAEANAGTKKKKPRKATTRKTAKKATKKTAASAPATRKKSSKDPLHELSAASRLVNRARGLVEAAAGKQTRKR